MSRPEPPPDSEAAPDGRAVRWDSHRASRQEKLIATAIDQIRVNGPDVGVRQIAEIAGIPRSVVYRFFDDRADLDEQIRKGIVDRLMVDLAPALEPRGTITEAIHHTAETYVRWCAENPRLHHFLGIGSASKRKGGSPTVIGTKTAIALQISALFGGALTRLGKDPAIADTVAFALLGLVDSSVNRWLANPDSGVTSEQLIQFLEVSVWQVLHANLALLGVELSPDVALSDLLGPPE